MGVHPLSAQESIWNSFSNCLFVLAKGWNLGFIHVAIYHCSKTGNIGNIHMLSNCGLYSCVVNLEHTEGIYPKPWPKGRGWHEQRLCS